MASLRYLLLLAPALLATSCAKGNDDDSSGADAWASVKTKDGAFSISVPPGWDAIDFTKGDFAELLDTAIKNNPSLAATGPQLKAMAAAGNFKLMIVNQKAASQTGRADNVTVLTQPIPANASVAAVLKESEQLIRRMGSKLNPTAQKVHLPGGQAYVIEASLDMQHPQAGKYTTYTLSYLFFDKSNVTAIGFSTTAERRKEIEPTFKKMAETIKLH